MNAKEKTKVFILGAGCSAGNGCPVADNFVSELELFGGNLNAEAARIKDCVEKTATLMRLEHIATIDDLTARAHAGCFDADSLHGSMPGRQRRAQRIKDAKIATAAILLSKEKAAKKTGLHNYHNFILKIF